MPWRDAQSPASQAALLNVQFLAHGGVTPAKGRSSQSHPADNGHELHQSREAHARVSAPCLRLKCR